MEHNELQSIYSYINNDLFHRIIQSEYRDENVTIDRYQLSGAIPKGENFASVIIRAVVYFTLSDNKQNVHEKRLIIKAGHSNEQLRMEMVKYRVFEKEIKCYSEVLPEVQRLLHQIGDHTKLAPKCYDMSLNDSYLIFEDLSEMGYKLVNKKISLDVDHYQLVMSKLSRWHAATAIMGSENVSQFDDFLTHLVNSSSSLKTMVSNTMRACAQLTKTLPGYEQMSVKLSHCIDTMYDKISKSVERNDTSFTALCHGDIWSNNIMFSYDSNGKPNDVIFLDFQACYWGPAVLDVANTLFTSSHENVRGEDWDRLVKQYHNGLSTMLKRLNYAKNIPSLEETEKEFSNRSISNSSLGLLSVGARYAGDTDYCDASIFFDDSEKYNEIRLKQFSHPNIRKTLEKLLNYFDGKGYFD